MKKFFNIHIQGDIMRRNLKYYFITAALILAMGICFTVFAKDDGYITDFLKSYGYEVSPKPIECENINIPNPLDEVYKGYNEIQKKAGFDLEPYAGRSCIRYTYEVLNYPGGIEGVRANVLVAGGRIIGGDICTLRLDGFMHGF